MGDAADDMFDAAMREQDRSRALMKACPCQTPRWVRDEETGLMHCLVCDAWLDE